MCVISFLITHYVRLAQLVERTAFNRMVVGSSPTVDIDKETNNHLIKLLNETFLEKILLALLMVRKFIN